MSYETGAPPPPPPLPEQLPPAEVVHGPDRPADVRIENRGIASARPARGYDASAVVVGLGGPPPGVTTYRLRAPETTETTD